MKRSTINQYLTEAAEFFAKHDFILPPFASWAPEEWRSMRPEASEARVQRLGWDLTDFNSQNFVSVGLTMFTLRNGLSSNSAHAKPYAEKIMHVRNNQVTPYHYHAHKMEDIINRGGNGTGQLVVQLYGSNGDGKFSDDPFTVFCDGIEQPMKPGGTIILGPGESITLPPFLYHTFHAINGDALIGEVSSTNDDDTDNYFYEPVGRYPEVDEDVSPLWLLCTEYESPR